MSKSKTVTLIDFNGFVLKECEPSELYYNRFWLIQDEDNNSSAVGTNVADIDTEWLTSYSDEAYREYRYLNRLVDFLNDQLTFIRNDMWETLLIYQATLGKYWEVPWIINPSIPIAQTEEIIYHKDGNRVKPKREYFLKHYPDVFSNLPAWKGE